MSESPKDPRLVRGAPPSPAASLGATLPGESIDPEGPDPRARPRQDSFDLDELLDGDGNARLGRYRLLEKLGEGGMGVVVAAHDEQLDRRVALKFLTRARQNGPARERLDREAKSLARLSHPNIVTVYEVGESEGMPFLAMELVQGQTLRDWLVGEIGRPSPNRLEILAMFLRIGRGLAAAHELGIVHRDFKPDNVLIGEDGRPRVLDFGLARMASAEMEGEPEREPEREMKADLQVSAPANMSLTKTGAMMGTPAYMGPEQWAGHTADARSDQFSFCVALFQAVYGDSPFVGDTMPALMHAVMHEPPLHVRSTEQLPSGLHAALVRGLAKDPDARWPGLEPLLALIEAALATAQPGLFDGPPPAVLRIMAPLFVGIPLAWLGLEFAGVIEYSVRNWAYVSGTQLVLVVSAVTLFRAQLVRLVNDPRVFAMPFLIALFIVGHRLIALLTGSSLEVMFAYDFLAAVGIGSIITYLVDRRVWPVVAFNVILAALATWEPSWGPRLWVAFSIGLPTTVLLSLMRSRDRLRGEATTSATLGSRSRSRSPSRTGLRSRLRSPSRSRSPASDS